MAIKKSYVCDLCDNANADQMKNGDWNSVRLKFSGTAISLRTIADSSASEVIICASCIANLYDAINKEINRKP